MRKPKFSNHFICHGCRKEFHRITPKEKQMKEHEQRKKTIEGYDDGDVDNVEVCDPCFRKIMKNQQC